MLVCRDSFWGYASQAEGSQRWSFAGGQGNLDSSVTRFGVGTSYRNNIAGFGTDVFRKDSPRNKQNLFAAFAYRPQNGGGSELNSVRWDDSGTTQVRVSFTGNGFINVYRGFNTSLIAQFSGAALSGFWNHWQVKVKIHPSAGEVRIRKDGALSDTFVATGLNTQVSANSYANQHYFRRDAALDAYTQDLIFWDDEPGDLYNDWIGDVRAVVLQPHNDVSAQFSRVSAGSLNFGTFGTGSNRAVSANLIQLAQLDNTPSQGGSFTSVSFDTNAGFTGKMKIALYLADGDRAGGVPNSVPGTLVAASDEITNPVTGSNTATFPSPVYIMKGYVYFWAIVSDTAFTMKANSLFNEYQYSIAYASGFPSSVATITTSVGTQRNFAIHVVLTATNAGCVNDYSQDNPTTYNKDNVVGHQDLFGLQPLWFNPTAIIGLSVRSFVLKTQSTAKGFKLIGQSGATPFSTTEYQPLTALTNFNYDADLDPNTGVPWLVPALAALQVGCKVNS